MNAIINENELEKVVGGNGVTGCKYHLQLGDAVFTDTEHNFMWVILEDIETDDLEAKVRVRYDHIGYCGHDVIGFDSNGNLIDSRRYEAVRWIYDNYERYGGVIKSLR